MRTDASCSSMGQSTCIVTRVAFISNGKGMYMLVAFQFQLDASIGSH